MKKRIGLIAIGMIVAVALASIFATTSLGRLGSPEPVSQGNAAGASLEAALHTSEREAKRDPERDTPGRTRGAANIANASSEPQSRTNRDELPSGLVSPRPSRIQKSNSQPNNTGDSSSSPNVEPVRSQPIFDPVSGGANALKIMGRLPLWQLGSQQRDFDLTRDASMAVIGGDQFIYGVDAQTGEILWRQDNHATPCDAVVISADNERVFTAGPRGDLTERKVQTGEIIQSMPDFGYTLALALSEDGSMLAAGLRKGTVKLVDAFSLQLIAQCTGIRGNYERVSFTQDGLRIYALHQHDYSRDHPALSCWNTADGSLIQSWSGEDLGIHLDDFSISPDGSFALLSGAGIEDRRDSVTRLDLIGGTLTSVPQRAAKDSIRGCAMNRTGDLAASLIAADFCLWNPGEGTVTVRCQSRGWAQRVKFSYDGRLVYDLDNDGHLGAWDTATGEPLHAPAGSGPPNARGTSHLEFCADGKSLLSAGGGTKLWNVESGEVIREIGSSLKGVLCGDTGVITVERYTPTLWDIETGQKIREYVVPERPDFAALVCHGATGRLYALTRNSDVLVWDVDSPELVRTISLPDSVTKYSYGGQDLVVSGDGRAIAVYTLNGQLWRISTEDGLVQSLYTIDDPHKFSFGSMEFTPDDSGLWFSVNGADAVMMLIDAASGSVLRRLDFGLQNIPPAQRFSTMRFALLPGGRLALAGGWAPSAQQPVVLIDLEQEAVVARFYGHTDSLVAIAVSPDGKTGVSAGRDSLLRVWDLTYRD